MDWASILNFTKENIAIITCLVTILGLYLNNRNLKQTFRNDFSKIHRERFLEEMGGLSHEVVDVMQEIMDAGGDDSKVKKSVKSLKNVENKILAHGSAKAIDICCCAQQNVYKGKSAARTLAILSLLICQLRFDLSGEILSYESWFKMKLNDYDDAKMKNEIAVYAAEVVKKMKLNKGFLRELS